MKLLGKESVIWSQFHSSAGGTRQKNTWCWRWYELSMCPESIQRFGTRMYWICGSGWLARYPAFVTIHFWFRIWPKCWTAPDIAAGYFTVGIMAIVRECHKVRLASDYLSTQTSVQTGIFYVLQCAATTQVKLLTLACCSLYTSYTASCHIIIIIIIMLTFMMRLSLQNKNIGAVQKYK